MFLESLDIALQNKKIKMDGKFEFQKKNDF